MKQVTLRCQAAGFLALSIFFAQSVLAQEPSSAAKGCSNATLKGSYTYTSTGTLTDSYVPPPYAGPFAEIGAQNFDGKGKTTGTATLSSNGSISRVTISGTYKLKSDCTGTMTLNIPELDATVHADFVTGIFGVQIRAIVTESGVVESRIYTPQF